MKMFLSSFSLLLLTAVSHASPTHLFWCEVSDGGARKHLQFQIEDSALSTGQGQITLSNWITSQSKWENSSDCGMMDAPCEKAVVDVNPQWVPFQQAVTKANISWSRNTKNELVITGVEVNMGRSGSLSAFATQHYNEFNTAPGHVIAKIMGLNFPQGVKAEYCSYFKSKGTKPGLTGSN